MSTRNMTMVIERDYASNHELGFAQNPELLTEHSHVNMYLHHIEMNIEADVNDFK